MIRRYSIWIRKSPKMKWIDAIYITDGDSIDDAIRKAKIDMEGMPFEWMVLDHKTNKTYYGKIGRYRKIILDKKLNVVNH